MPPYSPKGQLGNMMGQHQLKKKEKSEGCQALGESIVPKVAGGSQGSWRSRKGEKRTSQLILTNAVVWMN